MSNYKTIKELVIDTYRIEGGYPSEEKLTTLVKTHFPDSEWKKSHYSWYKSQIKTGKISIERHKTIIAEAPKKVPSQNMFIENRIEKHEKDICLILADLAIYIHPKIIVKIQEKNRQEFSYFQDLFADRIEITNYLFDGSACVFPGVRRYVSGEDPTQKYLKKSKAIIDDNAFPRYLWSWLVDGKGYSGPQWKSSGLNAFELAHVFAHKPSELGFEKKLFSTVQKDLSPYSDFSSACNVILLPKGTVKPTDKLESVKIAFYKRYIDLYGEAPLIGRYGFDESLIPNWYSQLKWKAPQLPEDWETSIEKLLKYRTQRITTLLK